MKGSCLLLMLFDRCVCSILDLIEEAENNYKLEKVQRRAARYVCHRYHNTSSVTEMMDDLSWPTLKERRTKTRQINFYKISNNKMEIPYRHTYAKSIKNQNFTLKNI
jgi:hypothetical protein